MFGMPHDSTILVNALRITLLVFRAILGSQCACYQKAGLHSFVSTLYRYLTLLIAQYFACNS